MDKWIYVKDLSSQQSIVQVIAITAITEFLDICNRIKSFDKDGNIIPTQNTLRLTYTNKQELRNNILQGDKDTILNLFAVIIYNVLYDSSKNHIGVKFTHDLHISTIRRHLENISHIKNIFDMDNLVDYLIDKIQNLDPSSTYAYYISNIKFETSEDGQKNIVLHDVSMVILVHIIIDNLMNSFNDLYQYIEIPDGGTFSYYSLQKIELTCLPPTIINETADLEEYLVQCPPPKIPTNQNNNYNIFIILLVIIFIIITVFLIRKYSRSNNMTSTVDT